jgi:flavin-dependent thymidylate synthase
MTLIGPNGNTVRLVGSYGNDETHALSAWVSTSGTALDLERKARIPKLLKMLADNGHGTPFEKSMLHFVVNTDVATATQLLKHRIGVSINAESARYQEIRDDDFYVPHDWPAEWEARLVEHARLSLALYHEAVASLAPVIGRKRAKETARFFRPFCSQVTSDVSFNWRSFVHFYRLRSAPDAQAEIRDVAEKMLAAVKALPGEPFKHTIAAFGL